MDPPFSVKVTAAEAVSVFRDLLDGAQHTDQHAIITRYGRPVAALVPLPWYKQAAEALAKEAGDGAS